MFTMPDTLILTVLPPVDAGTKHLIVVDDSKVVFTETELLSPKTMLHIELNRSKFADDVDTVTIIDPNRENGGVKTTFGT